MYSTKEAFDKEYFRRRSSTARNSGSSISTMTTRKTFLKPPTLDGIAHLYSKRFPEYSSVSRKNFNKAEQNWNSRFSLAFSKDNQHYHKLMREYFDRRKSLQSDPFFTQRNSNNPPDTKKYYATARVKKPSSSKKASKKMLLREKSWIPVFNPISEINLEKPTLCRKLFENKA